MDRNDPRQPPLLDPVALLLHQVLQGYRLPRGGDHGLAHWARVLDNGERLAARVGPGVDLAVVRFFAVLHDCRRVNEHHDPDHGPRAARLAERLRPHWIHLADAPFWLLVRACEGHTHERTHPDPTVQVCWDADRLDLGRVGITPHPSRMASEAGRDPGLIAWADGRARLGFHPEWIRDRWGLDPATWERV